MDLNNCTREIIGRWGKYCSMSCRTQGQYKGRSFSCFTCGRHIYKSPQGIKRSKSGNYFCSKKCQTVWRNKVVFIGENHPNWKHGESAYRRILSATNNEKVCTLCRISDERVIIVHHIDKNRNNNNITNLVWLCNNCHYLVHHYANEKKRLSELLKNSLVDVVQQ